LNEETKAALFLTCLDQILAGEKDIGPVEDAEVAELLQLARNIIAADIHMSGKARASLKKKLLERLNQSDFCILSGALKAEQGWELTEEELEYAAAGLQAPYDVKICPRCGARLDRRQQRCPVCGC
jgi:hypothetical protein